MGIVAIIIQLDILPTKQLWSNLEMTDKQSLIFCCSFIAITFSLMGWLCISYLSPNPYIWFLSVSIGIFIAVVEVYIMTEAIERHRDDR